MKKILLISTVILFLSGLSFLSFDLEASVFSDVWEGLFGDDKKETFTEYRLSRETEADFQALHNQFLATQKFWIGDENSDGVTVESERVTAKYENEIQKQIDDIAEINEKLENEIFPATCEVCDYQKFPIKCRTLCPEFR
jgi:hypothetical protein